MLPEPKDNLHVFNANQPRESKMQQAISLQKLVPNLLTLMALSAAITSVQMAINQKFDTAILMLVAAAVLDILDGAAARALKASSEFGAQLDSLSDFLAFGVAPSLLLYVWTLDEAGKLAGSPRLFYQLRRHCVLARFNVMAKKNDDLPDWKKRYFCGVPAPAGAGLVLLPAYIYQVSPETFSVFSFATPLIAIWAIFVSALMVSRIPTGSLKYMKLPAKMTIPLMAALGGLIAALIHAPWITLTILSLSYLISIPVVLHRYRQKEKQFQAQPENLSSLAFGISGFDHPAGTAMKIQNRTRIPFRSWRISSHTARRSHRQRRTSDFR